MVQEQPTQINENWNSDDPAFAGMSCKDAAKFLTGTVMAFRAFHGAKSEGGSRQVLVLLNQLVAKALVSMEKDGTFTSDERMDIGNASIGMALVLLLKLNPILLSEVSLHALEGLVKIIDEKGIDYVANGIANVSVAPGSKPGETIKIGIAMEPIEAPEKKSILQKIFKPFIS